MKLRILKILILIFLFSLINIKGTNSFFSDQVTITGVTISTGTWDTASSGSVVINEVMWMGSTESPEDEWIELKNTTDSPIDIGQWTIENAKQSHGTYHIPANKVIPANGYFLISNYPKTSANSALNVDSDVVGGGLELKNDCNGNLVLKDKNGKIVDQAKGDDWPEGKHNDGYHKSMERNDAPENGLQASNWHTCTSSGCKSTTYWKTSDKNYGTPKAANLSGEPEIETYLPENLTTFSFKVNNINDFKKLSYELTYDTESLSGGVIGGSDLNNQDEYAKDDIVLGSCSSGGKCTYDKGIKNMKLKVVLEDKDGGITTLEKTIL